MKIKAKVLGLSLIAFTGATAAAGVSERYQSVMAGAQPPVSTEQSFRIRFVPGAIPSSGHPILPSAGEGLNQGQAVARAATESEAITTPNDLSGVIVKARFGTFSDDVLSHRTAFGTMQLDFQNRPAWIITFSGPKIAVPGAGPDGNSKTIVFHEDNVVIDASTGAFMEGYSSR